MKATQTKTTQPATAKRGRVNPEQKESKLPIHPVADLMPSMTEDEYTALKEDIRINGLRQPIVVHKGKLLDGRHRLRACRELGTDATVQVLDNVEGGIANFVISMNLKRRHLNESQRALVASQLATTKVGANQHDAQAVSQLTAAQLLNVSVDSLQRARNVVANGTAYLIEQVRHGRIDVLNASAIADRPKEEQSRIMGLEPKSILLCAKEIRKEAMEGRRQARLADIEKKRAGNRALDFADRSFNVIYADPPWDYISEEKLGYPTMSLAEIKAMPVGRMAARDAVLFLWCSASLIGDALQVVSAWGFNYKTHCVWDKQRPGQGTYFRIQHELLLIATRGVVPEVPFAARECSVYSEASTTPSTKPKRYRDLIDRMYPELPKVELFCRGAPADGWSGWGNECTDIKQVEVSSKRRQAANDANGGEELPLAA